MDGDAIDALILQLRDVRNTMPRRLCLTAAELILQQAERIEELQDKLQQYEPRDG
jgi:hypothetical protein